jgi:hypothetical protein
MQFIGQFLCIIFTSTDSEYTKFHAIATPVILSNYTTAITRQQPVNSNRGMVFSMQSVQRCYKQGQLAVAGSQLDRDYCSSVTVNCCCEKLVAEARDSVGTKRKDNICC